MKYLTTLLLLVSLAGCHYAHYGYVLAKMEQEGRNPELLFRVVSASPAGPLYAFTDFHMQFYSNTDRQIKYVDVVVVPYDRVHEPAGNVRAFRVTGPITRDQFKMVDKPYAWTQPGIEYACIDSLRITYMDDEERIVLEEDADDMMFPGVAEQCANRRGGRAFTAPSIEDVAAEFEALAL